MRFSVLSLSIRLGGVVTRRILFNSILSLSSEKPWSLTQLEGGRLGVEELRDERVQRVHGLARSEERLHHELVRKLHANHRASVT